jgi:hypothetical protein
MVCCTWDFQVSGLFLSPNIPQRAERFGNVTSFRNVRFSISILNDWQSPGTQSSQFKYSESTLFLYILHLCSHHQDERQNDSNVMKQVPVWLYLIYLDICSELNGGQNYPETIMRFTRISLRISFHLFRLFPCTSFTATSEYPSAQINISLQPGDEI